MQSPESLLPVTLRSQRATPRRTLGRRAASKCTALPCKIAVSAEVAVSHSAQVDILYPAGQLLVVLMVICNLSLESLRGGCCIAQSCSREGHASESGQHQLRVA